MTAPLSRHEARPASNAPLRIFATTNGYMQALPGTTKFLVGGWDEVRRKDHAVEYVRADVHADLITALQGLVREHVRRGGAFDEPLGESEQTPEINAARAALAKAGAS